MALTVTWQDGTTPQTQFTVPDDVMVSLDQFRGTMQDFVNGAYVPSYSDVKEMIIGVFMKNVVLPALERFPTPAIQTATANLEAAQAALQAAQVASLPDFTPPTQ